MSERYGLLGHPVAGSLSPALYEAAFREWGIDASYALWDAGEPEWRERLGQVRSGHLAGVNVTIPYKVAAAEEADALTPPALAGGSVNTLSLRGGKLTGHSTDGAGALAALREARIAVEGARVCLLGTGGAARAVLGALLAEGGVREVHVLGRREEALAVVLSRFVGRGAKTGLGMLLSSPEVGPVMERADLIINATPAGMEPDPAGLPVEWDGFRPGQAVFDLIYKPRRTRLLERAAARGARTLDGLPMLVHQAALAFEWWTGRKAPLAKMKEAVAC